MVTAIAIPGRAAIAQPARDCGRVRVEIEGELRGRWAEAITRACGSVAALPDADATAHVLVRAVHGGLDVEVRLPDGRSASRRVGSPSALAPTLEALLTVPPAPRATPAVDPTNPPDLEASTRPPVSPYGVEAGGGLGGRLSGAGPYLAASLSGFVQARVHAWAFGVGVRWDAFQRMLDDPPPGFESEALTIALTAARRLDLDVVDLDVGISPRVVSQIQTASFPTSEQTGSDTDLRIGAFVRATPSGPGVRVYFEVDADASPPRLDRHLQVLPGFPDLPTWSVGLTAGAAWRSP